MKSIAAYVGAAFLEIGGCFAVWAWLRLGASPWWLVPGMLALAAFAWLARRPSRGGDDCNRDVPNA